ncbi:homeobox protein prospero isoform X2 [Microplitis mediator]|uniref:homeobox protein prospero isoform X2 n=1 Tax=Microplitis mediator TaxID=375433 RepID=UPI0025559DF8|nr:homeobox protein prospero isoform X2 [Microplitis mediator]
MMSSEEETDCFALYGATADSKQQQLLKKQKRTRQRVDAGEPRNSYSSIPNFSSRPSFLGGGIYGAIFSGSGPPPSHQQQQQQQQQIQQQSGAVGTQGHLVTTTGPTTQHSAHAAFGFFGAPGFGPAKMLNELLGRQVKQASDAGGSPPEGSHGMTGAGMDQTANLQPGAVVNCDDPTTAAELTQHMLRDILQGRKLSALNVQEQPNNNNSIHSNNNNNNNNNTTTELLKSQQHQQQSPQQHQNSDSVRTISGAVQSGGEESVDGNNINTNHSDRDTIMPGDAEDSAEDAASAARAMEEAFAEAGMEPGANLDGSDCEQSLPPSPTVTRPGSVLIKEEISDSISLRRSRSASHSPCPIVPKSEVSSPSTEIKRARVENIVSTMRSSPALQPVNGCKKRKLYQPQQQTVHHVLHHSVNDTMIDVDDEDSEEEEDPSTIKQKREEKDHLKIQLKLLHEQLEVMQRKYNELSSRMEPESSENGEPPASPQNPPQQPPPRPQRPHPPPFNGLSTLPPDHPHATAAAMYHMGQKLYFEQQHAALERMKQHQEVAARQQQQAQREREQQRDQHQQQQTPPPPSQGREQSQRNTGPSTPQTSQMQAPATPHQHKDYPERLNVFRNNAHLTSTTGAHVTDTDLEGLADLLKTEMSSTLGNVVDAVLTKFIQQRRFLGKSIEAAQVAAEQLSKDLLHGSQLLDRKSSPRTKVVDRGASQIPSGPNGPRGPLNGGPPISQPAAFPQIGAMSGPHCPLSGPTENNLNQINQLPPLARPNAPIFQTPKPPTIYAMSSIQVQQQQQQQREQQQREQQREQYCNLRNEDREARDIEQNEALSLVMTPKKKRHKVTDTRITPRTVSRILAQEGSGSQSGNESPPPLPPPTRHVYGHAAPPMLPVSLPTSVAIPNPSLHESQVFSPYSPFFNPHANHPGQVPPPGPHHLPASPPGGGVDLRDSPPLPHPPAMLHPALLAAAQHGSPDYGHLRMDSNDRGSDCNSGDISYDGIQPTSSTLTPMHLRKAKLMFFWVRYPSSAVLKMYFPDIKFNKNNTAQLVKWFSNFREFYYIQMEKYARQAVSEGVKSVEDLRVSGDSEIYRVLNLHYNRNNHIEVPGNFRYVVEQTLKEFFKAIQGGKDSEQSWKKAIYKVISRLDDPVPEYFKSPNFLEQLE